MTTERAEGSWKNWIPFSEPEEALITDLEASLRFPNTTWDEFYHDVIRSFHEDSDFFWIGYAIKYSSRAIDKAGAAADLEWILNHPETYGVLGGLFGSAASYLGLIAAYPNQTLLTLMQAPDRGDEDIDAVLEFARAAAFGAYVATATDFDFGMRAGRQVKASGRRPTPEQAEKLIRQWREQHA
ncbi:hypothetical protein [Deinococcus navajonensis]|uniref:SMI1/KNR4 family protein n=1 Tax=Deinococcus navajonensis TaxID=309884 RepID=A0ABV8XR35_9DEIO